MIPESKSNNRKAAENVRFAKSVIGNTLSRTVIEQLRELTRNFALSLRSGDLLFLTGGWYVTHTGLIRLAARRRWRGIHVQSIAEFSDARNNRFAFKATVYKSRTCPGFVGYGDADPSNVSFLVHGAEMRVAETRAVNRALRKAYGIGICSVEEIGSAERQHQSSPESKKLPPQPTNGNRRRSESSRSPLPDHPPASTRSQPGQGLRDGFLRRQGSSRCHARTGGKLRCAPRGLG